MTASNEQVVSYGLGWQFGRHLLTHNFDGLSMEEVIAGMRDCFEDKASPYTDEQAEEAFRVMTAKAQARHAEEAKQAAATSQQFLADNAEKPDVTVTRSGLQYRVIEMGEGSKAGPLDSVRVHYHGMLTNGQVFDSSVERKVPVEFPVQEVIKGWTEAMQLFPMGTRVRLFVPADLAYGEMGKPPVIPGNAALIFDLELLEIV